MMTEEKEVFEFNDYRAYLKSRVGPEGTRRGVRLAIARAIPFHSSYLTKILEGAANLSLEQALRLCTFLKLRPEETEYFLLLLQKERSGSLELRRHFDAKISEAVRSRLQLKARVPIKKSLSRTDQTVYYSSWRYAAVHMALTVPELRTRHALADYFGITLRSVEEVLQFLVSVGMAHEKNGTYSTGESLLHLEGDSPNTIRHHANWRTRAIVSLDHPHPLDLHYSSVMTVSRQTAEKLRERLVKTIRDCVGQVAEAPEEEALYCFSVDWFELKHEASQSSHGEPVRLSRGVRRTRTG